MAKLEQLSSDCFQKQIVDSLLVAANEGKILRLTQLSGQTELSTVCISPLTRNREASPPAKVFTTWCKLKSEYLVPNFVSLLVQPDGTSSKGYKRCSDKRMDQWSVVCIPETIFLESRIPLAVLNRRASFRKNSSHVLSNQPMRYHDRMGIFKINVQLHPARLNQRLESRFIVSNRSLTIINLRLPPRAP